MIGEKTHLRAAAEVVLSAALLTGARRVADGVVQMKEGARSGVEAGARWRAGARDLSFVVAGRRRCLPGSRTERREGRSARFVVRASAGAEREASTVRAASTAGDERCNLTSVRQPSR